MKRKLLLTTLLLTFTLCSIFGLTACGGNNDNNIGGGNSTIAVTSVTLNRSSLNLEIGDTVSLYETIYPSNATDKSATWSSSDTSVATVSNGYVVAKSSGTATITVKTSNNKTATCYVTVNPKTIEVTSISLNKTSATLEVGDTLNLTATIYPSNATDKNATWSSSNTSVATVSNGTVTAKSEGSTTITVRTSNNKTATCSITVNNPVVAVSSVSLNKTSATLEVGDTLNLTATIYPSNATDKSVTWSSSNTSVATVSNGIVTAKSEGSTTITVRTSNNKTATCYVTVNPKNIAVTSVELNKSSATIEVGNTLNLTATIYPSNATDKSVTWSSSNTSVATVSNGLVTAKSSGTATITVKTSNNKTATCTITVKNEEILPTAIYLSKSTVELNEGESITLTTTLLPNNVTNNVVEWIVTDTSVATVNNGIITAKSVGETMIIATTVNGLAATCTINVISPFVFEEYGTGYALIAYKGVETDVEVPSTYNGKKVIAIGTNKMSNLQYVPEGFLNCVDIVKVTLPSTILEINYGAFGNCYSLQDVNIPEGCIRVYAYAFANCTSLKNIVLPNSCSQGIHKKMFAGCSSLETITIPRMGGKLGWLFESVEYDSTYEDRIVDPDYYDLQWEWYLAHASGSDWIEISGKMALYQNEQPKNILESEYESVLGGFYQPIRARFMCYYVPTTLHTVIITNSSSYPDGAFYGWDGNILFS